MKTYQTIINDIETGENLGTSVVEVKENDIVITNVLSEKEAQNQNKFAKNKKELDAEIKEFIAENEGFFIYLIYKYGATIFEKLEELVSGSKCNIHIVRFIVLATFQTWHGNLYSNKNEVKKSSLKRIWDTTSRNSINETYNLLLECEYIYETEEGLIMINEDIITKGTMKEKLNELKKQDKSYTCIRLFANNIKAMYYGTESKQRKLLANLFKILPYINYKYNVFCSNPTETDEMKLELLSWGDLAELCGYDRTNVTRFKKDLWNLKIYSYCVIGEFHCEAGMAICVNPKVYYGGDNVNDVRNLYAMFKMCEKTI